MFQDASQIVNGDQVQVAGNSVGSVSSITLTPNGQAQLTINISNPTTCRCTRAPRRQSG